MSAPPPRLLLSCRVGAIRIALDAASVVQILPLLPLWRPPTLPRPLVGLIDVRGAVLPVLDPGSLFGDDTTASMPDLWAHIVRPRGTDRGLPCLLVDRVEDVVVPAPDAVRPVAADKSFNGAVVAEVSLADGEVAHLLSLDRLLDAAERAQVVAITAETSRRAALWSVAADA